MSQAGNAGLWGANGKREDEGEGQQGEAKSVHGISRSACAVRLQSGRAAFPGKYTDFCIWEGGPNEVVAKKEHKPAGSIELAPVQS